MFSVAGYEEYSIMMEKPLVTMAAYEDLLVVLLHDSPGFLGC